MMRIEATTTASPERLWETVADVHSWPEYAPTFTSVTPLDVSATGVGTRYRVKQPGLPAATYRISAWHPGHSFTWIGRSPAVTTTAIHTVRSDGDGAVLELLLEWTGPFAWLADRLLTSRAEKMIRTEADALTRHSELR